MWVRVNQDVLLNVDPDDLRSIAWDVGSLQVRFQFKDEPDGKYWRIDDPDKRIMDALTRLVGVPSE